MTSTQKLPVSVKQDGALGLNEKIGRNEIAWECNLPLTVEKLYITLPAAKNGQFNQFKFKFICNSLFFNHLSNLLIGQHPHGGL